MYAVNSEANLLADTNCGFPTSGCLGRQRATWRLGLLTCYDGDAINTNTKLTLLVFIVFFLALALAALWML
jgi:hypothetical protein